MQNRHQQRFASNNRGRSFSSSNSRGRSGGSGGRKHMGQYIAPERYIQKAIEPQVEVAFVSKHQFIDFGFTPALEALVAKQKFLAPTAIQDGVIPLVMEGKDVVGLANTGTGKTAAFLLPIIHKLKTNPMSGTALIVTPTRELAAQIEQEFRLFSNGLGLYATLCVGGTSLHNQMSKLRHRPHVVIGTPGRLKDLINRRALNLDTVGFFVLDEVDRMLDMGFVKEIELLMSQLPSDRQTVCLSATITPSIEQLLNRLLKNPVTISVRQGSTAQAVEQNIVEFNSEEHKLETLQLMLNKPEFEKVLVFGQTKHGVQRLADTLTRAGLPTEAIHGNKSQPQRARALQSFKAVRSLP
jgi:superfamily II DNA/RNA helicase